MSALTIRDAAAALLRDVLPIKVPLLRDALHLDDSALPVPNVVNSGELTDGVLGRDGSTYIEVATPGLLRSYGVVDWSGGVPMFHQRYTLATYVWALGDTWDAAMLARDQLGQAVASTYLDYPTLSTVAGNTGIRLTLTVSTRSGTPVPVNTRGGGSPRVWAPMALNHEVDSYERDPASTRGPLGQQETFAVTEAAVGPAVPFPDPDEETAP